MVDYVGVLEWCFQYHYSRDAAKSAERLGPVKYSPLTIRLAMALEEAVSTIHAPTVQLVLESVSEGARLEAVKDQS